MQLSLLIKLNTLTVIFKPSFILQHLNHTVKIKHS